MKISIIGAGSWGTALAYPLSVKNDVLLWTNEDDVLNDIISNRKNKKYLKTDNLLKTNVLATSSILDTIDCDIMLFVVPAHATTDVASEIAMCSLPEGVKIVACAKGIDHNSLLFPFQILKKIFSKNNIAVLCGPNFANEIADGKPSVADIAAYNIECASYIAKSMSTDIMDFCASGDPLTLQIAGVMKNIIAIACGMALGWEMGENMRALVFVNGFNEVIGFCRAMGCDVGSIYGPGGIGDLFLTSSSMTSRNCSFGFSLTNAKTNSVNSNLLSEGMLSVGSLVKLAAANNIKIPLCDFVYQAVCDPFSVSVEQYKSIIMGSCNEK